MSDVGTVLVLEDEMLVAVVMEDCLRDLGAIDVVICTTLREAESALATRRIDCAVLDVRVGGSPCFPIADKLAEQAIPFVFASASMPEEFPERHLDRERLSKPFSNEQLVEVVLAAIAAVPVKA
ncbi:response regulator [Devosia sp. CN2-171]|uniref:response regulator n=1 Tax=Devosia sp. CN2-171 TaxID=3400909 RepID=UPI003BF83BFB